MTSGLDHDRHGAFDLAFTFAFVLSGLVLSIPERASAASIDLDFFKPASPTSGYFCEESGFTLGSGRLDTALSMQYAHRPLVVQDQRTGAIGSDVVRDRIMGFATAAFGLTESIDVGARLSLLFQQIGTVDLDFSDGGVPRHPRSTALGDTDLFVRMSLLSLDGHDRRRFRLTLTTLVGIPTGARDALTSSGGTSLRPNLTAGWRADRWSAAATVGYVYRTPSEIPWSNLVVGHAVTGGAGFGYSLMPGLWVRAEASASAGLSSSDTGVPTLAAQFMAGPGMWLPGQTILQAGVGSGLNRSAGSPRLAGMITIGRVWSSSP